MSDFFHVLAMISMGAGLFFDFVGCLGLVRLPDVFNRLQAGTKCVTLGTFLLLLGVVFEFGLGAIGTKALLAMWFVAMTSPTAAHAIARGAHRSGVKLSPRSVGDAYAEDGEARGADAMAREAAR